MTEKKIQRISTCRSRANYVSAGQKLRDVLQEREGASSNKLRTNLNDFVLY